MIDLTFFYGTEIVFVRVYGSKLTFSTPTLWGKYSEIDGLNLNKKSTLKEFPDLENEKNWRSIAIKRFKEKLKSFDTENEVSNYVITELKKLGYIPKFKQRQGFRREVL